jgi:hypothetical protein
MPVISQKNAPLTGIANQPEFGGQQLAEQLSDAEAEEKRRKLLGLGARSQTGSVLSRTTPVLSPATLSLFGGMGGYGR